MNMSEVQCTTPLDHSFRPASRLFFKPYSPIIFISPSKRSFRMGLAKDDWQIPARRAKTKDTGKAHLLKGALRLAEGLPIVLIASSTSDSSCKSTQACIHQARGSSCPWLRRSRPHKTQAAASKTNRAIIHVVHMSEENRGNKPKSKPNLMDRMNNCHCGSRGLQINLSGSSKPAPVPISRLAWSLPCPKVIFSRQRYLQ